jgi:hypothetical protein
VPGPFHVTDPLPSGAFQPLPYGLLEVASVPADNSDPHWQRGVAYQTPCVTGATTYDECLVVTGSGGAPPAPSSKAENVDLSFRAALPFTVYARFDCSPVGVSGTEREQLAEQALASVQGWQVERTVWTGLADGQDVVFPSLSGDTAAVYSQGSQTALLQSPVVTGNSTATDAVTGVGLLEGLLGDCHAGVGVIHVPQAALPTIWPLVKVQGGRLKTLAGNDVAVGAGYPGTGPGGVAAGDGEAWLYGTGPVFAYRGERLSIREPADALDRANNTLSLLAERTFAVGWGCCHFAVLISLGASSAGGGGVIS